MVSDTTQRDVERWFDDNGLPYFVAGRSHAIESWLSNRRILLTLLAVAALSAGAGVTIWRLSDSASIGTLCGVVVFLTILGVYAGRLLRMATIARWAVRRTFDSLGLLFPLATRALPLLLLFNTFLFINTEVWQVASGLRRDLLWISVLFFATIAVVFMLVRLPEEVRRVEREVASDRLAECCEGTPVEGMAPEHQTSPADTELSRLGRLNLVLVLLFNQAIQVLLLSIAVLAFFLVFGKLAVTDDVITTWLGDGHPDQIMLFGRSISWGPSNELFQVSLFLAAFSGLYFSVYAVTDEKYRAEFFSSIEKFLERAIAVHTVYRTLPGTTTDGSEPTRW